MKSNIVPLSSFSKENRRLDRLDAEFVDAGAIAIENRLTVQFAGSELASLPMQPVATLRKNVIGAGLLDYVAIDDVDLEDGFLFHQTIAPEDLPSRARHRVRLGDLLISNVRPERGAIGFVSSNSKNILASSGFTVVRLGPNSDLETHFLFAFLKTRFARSQLVRRARGSMYPAVPPDEAREIVVPKVPAAVKEEVCDLVAQSVAARKQFIEAWNDQQSIVEEYLKSNLGPPPPDPVIEVGDIPCFHVAKSHAFFDLEGPRRFDAEFFRREFVEFTKRLAKSKNVFKLGERFTAFSGKSPRAGGSTALKLRQAQLTGFGVNLSGLEEVEVAVTAGSKSVIQKMDVLLACTAHEPYYVARRVDIVDELASNQTPIIPVPDVLIIRERAGQAGNPHFLNAFLNTSWGRLQIQRLNRGVRGGHIYGSDVEEFVWVPEPQPNWLTSFTKAQIAIRSLRSQSIESIKAAIDKLQTALK